MPLQIAPIGAHPQGEPHSSLVCPSKSSEALQPARVPLDVHVKRLSVEWDPQAPVTPLGQLVYFSQCDIEVTIKTLYGRQEGAQVGYNPHQPGRPAHAYHTFFISRLRLALDVVVVPGKQFHSRAVSETFWQWWEQLRGEQRPYLFRLRLSKGCVRLIEKLSRKRRVIVRRRRVHREDKQLTDGSPKLLLEVDAADPYEYEQPAVLGADWGADFEILSKIGDRLPSLVWPRGQTSSLAGTREPRKQPS